MGCFSCMWPRRKDVRDYEEDMTPRYTDSSGGKKKGNSARTKGKDGNVARSFQFKELAMATQNFRDANLIGEGGFGSVYKGRLDSGLIVAVKQLNHEGLQGNQEFIVEVLMLSLLHHTNLVNLIGYCADGDQRLLVYEYMPMGSLENHLFDIKSGQEPLSWSIRLKIAVEYAMSGKLTLKSDIYSFGVVMLELITGRRAIDTTKKPGEQNLVAWSRPFLKDRRMFVQIVDPLLEGCFSVRSLQHAVAITAMCLQEQANFRPLISDIVMALEYLASQADSSDSHKGGYHARTSSSPSQIEGNLDSRK
ncbi:unnamed protein product [Fraxinus pennsylvanica]|uniref:non-specific serine/threonine protein kinase n=1 Tax=Fraxinus pennsylvanica TaxID=56036 RepID=A0AAD2DT82_9LAMI|nr:unnamed protein product [Fraxinus pennsylvanica]